MITRLTQPSVKGRRSIRTGSLPATQPGVARATAAALPQVTRPHSAPVSSAMRRPAASISSSRLTKCCDAATIAARTCGSIRLPLWAVRTLAQLMNGRTPSARYGSTLRNVTLPSSISVGSLGRAFRQVSAPSRRKARIVTRKASTVVVISSSPCVVRTAELNRRAPIRCRPSEPRPGGDAVPKTNPQPRCGAVVDLRTCGLASALAAELRSRCAQPGAVRLLFCAISADFHLAPATLLVLGRIEEQPATMVAGALLDARHVALHQQRQGGEGERPEERLAD